jgi:hypothetical protein
MPSPALGVNGESLNGGGPHVSEILDDGEDVSHVPDRELIIRSVNASLEAKHIVDRLDELEKRVEDLHLKLDTILDLLNRPSRLPKEP